MKPKERMSLKKMMKFLKKSLEDKQKRSLLIENAQVTMMTSTDHVAEEVREEAVAVEAVAGLMTRKETSLPKKKSLKSAKKQRRSVATLRWTRRISPTLECEDC
jgi:hypothetical protein